MWAQIVGRRGVCVQRSRECENRRQNDHLPFCKARRLRAQRFHTHSLVCVGVWVGSKLVTHPCSDPHRGNSSPLLSSLPPLLHLTCVVRLALDVNNLQLNNRFTYLFSSNDDTSSPLLNLWLVSFLCSLKRVVLHMNDAVPWVICQRLLYSLSFRPNLYITVQTEDFCFPDKSVKSLHFLHKVRTVSITTLIN